MTTSGRVTTNVTKEFLVSTVHDAWTARGLVKSVYEANYEANRDTSHAKPAKSAKSM